MTRWLVSLTSTWRMSQTVKKVQHFSIIKEKFNPYLAPSRTLHSLFFSACSKSPWNCGKCSFYKIKSNQSICFMRLKPLKWKILQVWSRVVQEESPPCLGQDDVVSLQPRPETPELWSLGHFGGQGMCYLSPECEGTEELSQPGVIQLVREVYHFNMLKLQVQGGGGGRCWGRPYWGLEVFGLSLLSCINKFC